MTTERTELGREIETAMGEVLAHVRGETALPCRTVDDPELARQMALAEEVMNDDRELLRALTK